MGRLLDGLRAGSKGGVAANPANPAKVGAPAPENSRIREIREAREVENQLRRGRLLTLAAGEGLPAALVHAQSDAGLALCDPLPSEAARAYLRALDASDRIDSGLVPAGWIHRLHCAHCGPVWWHRGGSVLACPWCARQRAGKAFPRPASACGDCRSFLANALNPEAGIGRCALDRGNAFWPGQRHPCAEWRPMRDPGGTHVLQD